MGELLDALTSWPTLLLALVVFGFAPGAVLRLILLAYHPGDPRRQEMRAELRAVPRWERPLWVCEQLEMAVFDGLPGRIRSVGARRTKRWRLGSGIASNRLWPDLYPIPSEEGKDLVKPGYAVKLLFQMRSGRERWGESMWVDVVDVSGRRMVGRLAEAPMGIPRLSQGDRIKFRREHIIGIALVFTVASRLGAHRIYVVEAPDGHAR